jgi:site-specific recombinase XerC
VEDYLRLRRALGFKLERAGYLLPQLVAYLQAAGAATLTSELAIGWARLPAHTQPNHWAQRLAIARGFARYLHTLDPATQVPPAGVFPTRRHRPTPFLWSPHDIGRLLESTRALRPALRAATYEALFGLLATCGMRVGEAVGLDRDDVDLQLTVGANVHTIGKGRKERRTPLVAATKAILHAWLSECPGAATDPLFPTITGSRLSRDAIERRLAHHIDLARAGCPSLQAKQITMHTLRHTAAMRLLLAGNDVTVIALWLGHEQIATTNIYLHADLTHKQQAIDRTKPLATKPGRYRAPDSLLAFLEAL